MKVVLVLGSAVMAFAADPPGASCEVAELPAAQDTYASNTSNDGDVVRIFEASSPKDVQIVHDFRSGRSWPHDDGRRGFPGTGF